MDNGVLVVSVHSTGCQKKGKEIGCIPFHSFMSSSLGFHVPRHLGCACDPAACWFGLCFNKIIKKYTTKHSSALRLELTCNAGTALRSPFIAFDLTITPQGKARHGSIAWYPVCLFSDSSACSRLEVRQLHGGQPQLPDFRHFLYSWHDCSRLPDRQYRGSDKLCF